jgi:hypothetical protein
LWCDQSLTLLRMDAVCIDETCGSHGLAQLLVTATWHCRNFKCYHKGFSTSMSELKSWRPIVHGLLEPSKNDPIQQLAEKATIYDIVWRFSPGYHNCFTKAKLLDPESR